jgi:hypothetical protein
MATSTISVKECQMRRKSGKGREPTLILKEQDRSYTSIERSNPLLGLLDHRLWGGM